MPIYTDIVITGPESTGKTTLATALSNQFGWPMVIEYARTYLHNTSGYGLADLYVMAKGQCAAAAAARIPNLPLIHDTDLLTYLVWAEDKFDVTDDILAPTWDRTRGARPLYLLCKPTIAWEPDPLREDPHRLLYLYDRHMYHLDRLGLPFYTIDRQGDARTQQAIDILINVAPHNKHKRQP